MIRNAESVTARVDRLPVPDVSRQYRLILLNTWVFDEGRFNWPQGHRVHLSPSEILSTTRVGDVVLLQFDIGTYMFNVAAVKR